MIDLREERPFLFESFAIMYTISTSPHGFKRHGEPVKDKRQKLEQATLFFRKLKEENEQRIHGVALSLLLVLALPREFFSNFSGFPPSTKINTSKFQFDLNVDQAHGYYGYTV